MPTNPELHSLQNRFRGFYPVVIDIETAGFNAKTDALLEIGITTLNMDENGWLKKSNTLHFHIIPFHGSIIQPDAIAFNKIDPFNPLRGAVEEQHALKTIFSVLTRDMKIENCTRSILVGHNANFDHKFLMAAIKRTGLQNHVFHPFVIFDTAALSGLVLGQTVLAKACKTVGIFFNNKHAHSALYDSGKTAELFCVLINRWKKLGGWPP